MLCYQLSTMIMQVNNAIVSKTDVIKVDEKLNEFFTNN